MVTDANGMVASGLTAADFTILEDTRPQRLETFTEVALPFVTRQPGSAPPPAGEVRTNRGAADGRVYVLLLDDSFVMAARTTDVRQLVAAFLDQYVQPGDLVAVATTSGVAGGTQAFTDDMRLVRRAVDRFVGRKTRSATVEKLEAYYRAREMDPNRSRRADPRNPTFNRDGAVLGVNAIDDELLNRGTAALRTVKGVVQSLAAVSGRRRTLLYLSEGIDAVPWLTRNRGAQLGQGNVGLRRAVGEEVDPAQLVEDGARPGPRLARGERAAAACGPRRPPWPAPGSRYSAFRRRSQTSSVRCTNRVVGRLACPWGRTYGRSKLRHARTSCRAEPGGARAQLGEMLRAAAQFHGRRSPIRLAGWSGSRASTSASQACGSTPLSLAVSIRV